MSEITWIKLKTDMFENEKIKLIEALPESDTLIVIWIKLLTSAGKCNSNGYIMITENIPMNIEEMATIFNRNINTVRLAIQTFQRYGMIEIANNDVIRIKNWELHQNVDGMDKVRKQNRLRKQKQREKEKQLQLCHVTSRDSHATEQTKNRTRIEEEQEIDKDKQTTSSVVSRSLSKNADFAKIVSFYEQNIGPLKPMIAEDLGFLMDEYKDSNLIIEAFKLAIYKNAKNKYNYAKGVLTNWANEMICTYEQLKAKEAREHVNVSTNNGQATSQVSEFVPFRATSIK